MSVADPTAPALELLIDQLGFSHFAVKANTADLTHAESLMRPTPSGNCLNWVLGHIVESRIAALEMLGGPAIWDVEVRQTYQSGGPPFEDPARALPFEEILETYETTQELLSQALSELPPQRLAEKAPFSPTGNTEETVGSLLTAIVFHDAYHSGQTGLLRRLVGREGAIG